MPSLPAQLSDDEKSRIRFHMGYPGIRAGATFILGMPATIETAYLIESAMNQVRVEDVPQLRRILDVLDTFNMQDVEDLSVHVASKVGEIELNPKEHELIDSRYNYWLGSLENLLAVMRNPDDKRFGGRGYGSVNRRVVG